MKIWGEPKRLKKRCSSRSNSGTKKNIFTSRCLTVVFSYCHHSLMAQQPLLDQGFPIIEASLSLSFRHTTLGKTPLDE